MTGRVKNVNLVESEWMVKTHKMIFLNMALELFLEILRAANQRY